MSKYWLTIALLLLAPVGNQALAAEPPEHQSKNARKALSVLGSMGVTNPSIRNFIKSVDGNIKDGYLTLAEEKVPGGTVKLHYELSGGLRAKQIELRFTPDNSNWRATARPDAVMVSYSIKLN